MIGPQIAPKNIINQPGNREVEDRLERKIGAGINFIATSKMIISPSPMISASKSISIFFVEQMQTIVGTQGVAAQN